jgi:hypothetical protein
VTDAPLPSLQVIFEAVAGVMGLDKGQTRLELIFHHGRLVKYYVHTAASPRELGIFEEQARWILEGGRLG